MWEAGSVVSGASSQVTQSTFKSKVKPASSEYSYGGPAKTSINQRPSQGRPSVEQRMYVSQALEQRTIVSQGRPSFEHRYSTAPVLSTLPLYENASTLSVPGPFGSSTSGSSVPGPFGSSGVQPTYEQLLQETRRILSTADLMTLTKKQIRDELGGLFGVNLKPRKEELNQMIDALLQGQL